MIVTTTGMDIAPSVLGKNSVPVLIQALQNPEVRQYITELLARIGEDA